MGLLKNGHLLCWLAFFLAQRPPTVASLAKKPPRLASDAFFNRPKIDKTFQKSDAFSLIELLFALVIVSTILGITIPRMRQGLELHLKTSARKLSSTIRFCYNESVMKNKYYRIVFFMNGNETHTYRVEYADEPFFIRNAEQEEAFQKRLSYSSEREKEEILKKEIKFIPIEEHLAKKIKLPKGVFFKDIFISHQPQKILSGEVKLHFFPNGFTEYAIINLADRDGNTYSLETAPLTGKTLVRPEYWDVEKNES